MAELSCTVIISHSITVTHPTTPRMLGTTGGRGATAMMRGYKEVSTADIRVLPTLKGEEIQGLCLAAEAQAWCLSMTLTVDSNSKH